MNQSLKYLTEYSSQSTVGVAKSTIREFLRSAYGLSESEDFDLGAMADKYVVEKRDFQDDITNWLAGHQQRNSPPLSMRTKMSAIRVFLSENDIEMSYKFWKKSRRRIHGNSARTVDRLLKPADIRKIIMNVTQPVGKALLLVLASSGARIGEVSRLATSDIDFNSDPVRITLRYTKSGDPRTVFISSEAREFLTDYLDHRQTQSDLIFPFTEGNSQLMLNNSLKRIGLDIKDSRTNRMTIHNHTFRKFFNTTMKSKGCPEDIVEALLGHKDYVKRVYGLYSIEQLAEHYKKAEPFLTVMSDQEELIKLKQEEAQNNGRLGDLFAKYKQLEEKLSKVSTMMDELEVVLAKMEAK